MADNHQPVASYLSQQWFFRGTVVELVATLCFMLLGDVCSGTFNGAMTEFLKCQEFMLLGLLG